MDELLQSSETPMDERYYEQRIEQLFTQMQLGVALDAARWPNSLEPAQTFGQGIRDLQTNYLDARRVHLFETHGVDNDGVVPDAQPAGAKVELGAIGFVARARDRDQEYLALVNPNAYAVDLSGWSIKGPIDYEFAPGVVVPSGGTLYVSPDVVAFRHRTSSPTGGEGHFVQGNYDGRLSEKGGLLRLENAQGMLVDSRFHWSLSALSRWLLVAGLVALGISAAVYLRRLIRP
jgi:hypothetical protein